MTSRRLYCFFAAALLFVAGCNPDRQAGSLPAKADPVKPVAVQGIPTANAERVSLLAFGDWGEDSPAERQVASGIIKYAQQGATFDAGLLLGDNFYFSLTGVNDVRWKSLFEELYEPKDLRFWAVLGNHDYRTLAGPANTPSGRNTPPPRKTNADIELAYSQLHPDGRFNIPARWYRIDLPPGDPMVTVLMLDSNYGLASLSDRDWKRQYEWLETQLKQLRPAKISTSVPAIKTGPKWIICCAHHPIYTNGFTHTDDARLEAEWLPLFERHRVDLYLTGHNHCMEHLQVPGVKTSLAVSGGGGADLYSKRERHVGWFSRTYGFTHLTAGPDKLDVRFIDADGKPVYRFTRTRDGKEQVEPTP